MRRTLIRAVQRRQTLFVCVFTFTALLALHWVGPVSARYEAVGQLRLRRLLDASPLLGVTDSQTAAGVPLDPPPDFHGGGRSAFRGLRSRDGVDAFLSEPAFRAMVARTLRQPPASVRYTVRASQTYDGLEIIASGVTSDEATAVLHAVAAAYRERQDPFQIEIGRSIKFLRQELASMDNLIRTQREPQGVSRLTKNRAQLERMLRQLEERVLLIGPRFDTHITTPKVRQINRSPQEILALCLVFSALLAGGIVLLADRCATRWLSFPES